MKAENKLDEKQYFELVHLHAYYRAYIGDKDMLNATAIKNQILGYLTALKTIGQITEADKDILFVEFTRMASLK